jgi:hypothetical protein
VNGSRGQYSTSQGFMLAMLQTQEEVRQNSATVQELPIGKSPL